MIVKIKPVSVNECWQGKRFKTKKYKSFEQQLLYILPAINLPPSPYELIYTFYFSNFCSDIDNPVKPITDILQKKYSFNDKDVLRLIVEKKIVKKGSEFFSFEIKHYYEEAC
jgi:Holliday junction resolvase RusA-like endonuclease